MSDRSVLVRLQANIADFKTQMEQARKSVKGVGDESEKSSKQASTTLGRMAESAHKNRQAWDDAGRTLVGFGAVATVAIAGSVKAAIDWESAWAGVTKTVSGTPEQLGRVEEGLRGLARTLPATHGEIAAVAEAAGQLGVKTESIVGFTKTMVNLGETTNLSADEAATALAQLMNVMQTAPQDVGRLGAALVALGNDGASTEADIVRMASYLVGSAKLIGASESDVLALANAMTSMGINAERGGGVMTRVMQDVYAAVQSGGDQLQSFADVAGMSSAEFARKFRADPIAAIDSFVQGLNTVEKSGGNVVETLAGLGYVGTQDTAVLLQMKGAGDLLTESLDLGNEAWRENTALVQEAAKRYDTTASKLEIARNNITDAGIEIGDVFLPILADLASGVADVAGWFADLPDPIQAVIGGFTGVAGVAALAGGGFLLLFPRVIDTYNAFKTLRDVSPGTATALGRVGKAAGIAGAFIAVASAVDGLIQSMGPAAPTMEETTKALLGMGTSVGSVDAQFRGLSRFGYDIDGFADAARRLTDPSLGDRVDDFFSELVFWSDTYDQGSAGRTRVINQLDQMGESLALMVDAGNAELAADQFDQLAAEWKRGGGTVENLLELMPAYQKALDGLDNDQKIATDSAQDLGGALVGLPEVAGAASDSVAFLGSTAGMTKDQIDAAVKAVEAWHQSMAETAAAFTEPLSVYRGLLEEKTAAERTAAEETAAATEDSSDSWEDYVTDVSVSLDEYAAKLEEKILAQENWRANVVAVTQRGGLEIGQILFDMGEEGAGLVQQMVDATDADFQRMADLMIRDARFGGQGAATELDLAMQVMAQIGRDGASTTAQAIADELGVGAETVRQIAAQYGVNLASGINPLLTALGKNRVSGLNGRVGGITEADGGVVDYYADGGVENHVAQIAPAGAWRVWAEPETGGEAYIPLSPSKRTRSVDIWREVGKRLGVELAEFAFGGINDVPRPRSTAPYQPPISTAGDATMQKAYDEVTAWLRANTEAIQGGTAGSGAVTGAWGSIWQFVKARVPQARINSAFRAGDPGYHGRGKAVDLGFGTGPGGAGSAGLALINRVLHDGIGRNLAELIYDGIGDDRSDLKNGRPFTYSAGTRAQHHNHVHAAVFGEGGILNPHVRDAGGPLLPGFTFNGTGRPETVLPNHVVDAGTSAAPPIDYGRLAAALRQAAPRPVTVHTADNPRAIVRAIRADEQQQAALAPVW